MGVGPKVVNRSLDVTDLELVDDVETSFSSLTT